MWFTRTTSTACNLIVYPLWLVTVEPLLFNTRTSSVRVLLDRPHENCVSEAGYDLLKLGFSIVAFSTKLMFFQWNLQSLMLLSALLALFERNKSIHRFNLLLTKKKVETSASTFCCMFYDNRKHKRK